MPTESKLRQGVLTLDANAFATQAMNVVISPETKEDGDALELLSGDVLAPDETTTWQLKAKALQDFTDPLGLQAWSWENAGETVPFTWKPNGEDGVDGPTYTGNVKVRALDIGGDVGKRLDVDLEWNMTGKPTVNYAQA